MAGEGLDKNGRTFFALGAVVVAIFLGGVAVAAYLARDAKGLTTGEQLTAIGVKLDLAQERNERRHERTEQRVQALEQEQARQQGAREAGYRK